MNNYQTQLIECESLDLDLPDANIVYTPNFIDAELGQSWFDSLLDEIDWQQETITVYGKQHKTPRVSSWMGDIGLNYRYSNMTMTPVRWTATALAIKAYLEQHTNQVFNSVLVNYYRDGQDSNGWHADDEPELGDNPIIASISLGAPRDFHLRHSKDKGLKTSLSLEHGSLLMMQGTTQKYWQHHVPKRANAAGRINLTFRMIKNIN